jgi:hypothetical protein
VAETLHGGAERQFADAEQTLPYGLYFAGNCLGSARREVLANLLRAAWEAAEQSACLPGLWRLEADRFCRHLNYAARATSLSIPSSYSTGVR